MRGVQRRKAQGVGGKRGEAEGPAARRGCQDCGREGRGAAAVVECVQARHSGRAPAGGAAGGGVRGRGWGSHPAQSKGQQHRGGRTTLSHNNGGRFLHAAGRLVVEDALPPGAAHGLSASTMAAEASSGTTSSTTTSSLSSPALSSRSLLKSCSYTYS